MRYETVAVHFLKLYSCLNQSNVKTGYNDETGTTGTW